jgi:hypothetical protein
MLRRDIVAPSQVLSRTDSALIPNVPLIEILDPSRAYDRTDMELPKWAKSKTDIEEPTRIIPNNETDEPRRENCRSDSEDPTVAMSKTDSEEPRRDTPNTDSEEPKRR